jgi:hypothetical protein
MKTKGNLLLISLAVLIMMSCKKKILDSELPLIAIHDKPKQQRVAALTKEVADVVAQVYTSNEACK